MTGDSRYVVSVSNKIITSDVTTGDLSRYTASLGDSKVIITPILSCRIIYPTNVEGLMMDIDISPSNRYVAAFTNNSQIIIVDTLTNEYKVKESPFQVPYDLL